MYCYIGFGREAEISQPSSDSQLQIEKYYNYMYHFFLHRYTDYISEFILYKNYHIIRDEVHELDYSFFPSAYIVAIRFEFCQFKAQKYKIIFGQNLPVAQLGLSDVVAQIYE